MGHYGQWDNPVKFIDPEETHSTESTFPVHE
jgi:hypothetical protein